MSFTREKWAVDLLAALGNTHPSQDVVDFVIGWTTAETIPPGALFNLLNTTEPWKGSTDFNSAGVRNYASYIDGIAATVATLNNGRYPHLFTALQNNATISDSPDSSLLTELSTWCGGCTYGHGFVSMGANHHNDTFLYGSPPSSSSPSPAQIESSLVLWRSYYHDTGKNPPPDGTGIYQSWFDLHMSGVHVGVPVTWEFPNEDWNGVPIIVQVFTGGWCEWKNGAASWFGVSGVIK